MDLIELRDADAVDRFLTRDWVVLLFVDSGRDQQPDAVLAALCARAPVGKAARTYPYGGAADRRVRAFLAHLPQTDRACLVLMQGAVVLDLLRSTDVEAHGARGAAARFAERFLTRLADG
ncbi:hypothetical protein [Streptomyces subrutilus]|uniref:Uncharacterized protein n=1 Tax=Streptomyces subrutilus TaxID=36818 RepID=A0A1E5PL89_9ACTN|nr:hypothetical protein [Streptomyces subrutilus]OEJ30338.1 hypothetical protein BGK67_02290 [Streptomyces subrutilus]